MKIPILPKIYCASPQSRKNAQKYMMHKPVGTARRKSQSEQIFTKNVEFASDILLASLAARTKKQTTGIGRIGHLDRFQF